MQNISKYYIKKVKKLFYEKYLYLILLFYKIHKKFRKYINAKYYRMMNKKNTKFTMN